MIRFLLRRLAISVLVALSVSIVAFALLRMSGDLAQELAGERATAEQVEAVRVANGLDRPLPVQYLDWAQRALRGDLGVSLFSGEPAASLIAARLPVTATLALTSMALALALAVPLGVIAATRPNSWIDRVSLMLAVFGQAIPNFWFGLILMLVFGVYLRWTPISGSDTLAHFVLPSVTLGLSAMPAIMRMTRSGMIDALDADYVRTARAKGLLMPAVLVRHALRNAVLPVVSITAVQLGALLGGSVVVESVFALNGIGQLAYQSIQRLDFPVVQAIVLMVSFIYIVLTFLSDIANARLDPRIRLA
ncbi:MAG: ABC transporter permease [Rhodospirillales bacterium]|jgi:peptide/nickel transport system permease protein